MHVKSVFSRIYFQVLTKDQPRRKRVDVWGDKMMEQKDMSLPLTMKTPKSQLITEQQSNGGKKQKNKRYLTPKDKEKAAMRQRESSEPQIILPSLKVWQWKEEPPENLALKGSRI